MDTSKEKELLKLRLKSKNLEKKQEWENSLLRKIILGLITLLTVFGILMINNIDLVDSILYSSAAGIIILISNILLLRVLGIILQRFKKNG